MIAPAVESIVNAPLPLAPPTGRQLEIARHANWVYRPFFISAILTTLTLGASWGAALLWKLGASASFTSISIQHINAHGEAQLFGWVGLFIMGFAYQAFPRMWQTKLVAPKAAIAVLAFMLAGLTLRTVGMTLSGAWPHALATALLGGGLQLAAIATFLVQMMSTFERRRTPFEPYMAFILVALAWFGLSSVFSVWYMWLTMMAGSREDLLFAVSTYQAALRDAQIHGVALMMILGVSMKVLPSMFGVQRISGSRAITALFVLAIAVAGEVSLMIGFRWTEAPQMAGLVYATWVLLATGVAMIMIPWKLWQPMPLADGSSDKFVRAAYIWLGLSLTMLLLLPVYQVISKLPFSHAYYGAIRHAMTVGFISMMIMGIGGKVIPALRGVRAASHSRLWGPFVLVNVGCAIRVTLQPLTDASSGAFKFLGVSGTLEVLGLAWWGLGLLAIMLRRPIKHPDDVAVQNDKKSYRSDSPQECCSCCSTKPERTAEALGTGHLSLK